MENFNLQTAAQQLKDKKAQIEESVAKLLMEAQFNTSGFHNYLHQRVVIKAATEGSTPNPDSSFQQEIITAMAVYQIPFVKQINQAYNLQRIFPFAGEILLDIPQPGSSAIVIENNLQVIGQKLLQKKAQVEAILRGLQMEIRINLASFYEYLIQRLGILAVDGGSIPDHVLYLQEEIAKAISLYHVPLAIALNEAFSLHAVFLRENQEQGQQHAPSQAGTSSAAGAAANQPENEANPGIVALLEVDDEYIDIKSEPNSDVEEEMPDGAGDSWNEPEDYARADAERLYNMFKQSRPPGRVNPNRRPSGPIKEEIVDDNPLALVLYQPPPAGHRDDSGSIAEQEEIYFNDEDESVNEDSIVDEESDHLEEQDVIMSDEDEEASSADDDGNDSNEDSIMHETDDDEDADENMSDIEDEDQNDNEEEASIVEDDEESDGTISDETNDEEDGQEEEAQPALSVAGPSSNTLRRSTRNSARVTKASSGQEQQANRRVSRRQTVAGKSSNGPRNGRNVETEPLGIITKKLNCTVPGCKKVVKNKNALIGHLLSSHKLKKYRCLVRQCYGKVSASFTTQAQYTDHLDKVHGRTSKLACHCSKKFKSYQELSTHYGKYHQLGLFACPKEDCTFKSTSTRVKVFSHLRIHFEAKYECPIDGCDWSFKLKSNLDRHLLSHTGERSFPCTECGKSFTENGNLMRHRRVHLKDKCYRCTWQPCTYSASDRSAVIRHIRVLHFQLPQTKRQQREEGIEDDRNPRDYLAQD